MNSFVKFFICSLLFINQLWSIDKTEFSSKIPQEALDAVRDNNLFALDFYKQVVNPINISFSPFSISSAFAMVYNGAKGDTQKEMASFFHFPKTAEQLNKGWFWLNKFLTFYPSNSSDEIRIRFGNSLWVQTNFPVLPAFRDTMTNYFADDFRFVDFKAKADLARFTINAWVKQSTFGKIADILPPQSVNSTTRMVLISALYLKARWQNTFDVHSTSQQPFFGEDGSTLTTMTMSQVGNFPYLDTPEASILEMPYIKSRREGPEFSMLVILPHQNDGLIELERNLNLEKIEQWIKNLTNSHLIVTLPKFRITQSFNLDQLLTGKGMGLPFSDQADFSGISGVKGLKIGNVTHKIYLSVDETGSEAAAASAIGMSTKAVQKNPIIFQADHPFMYIIFEKSTGMILFMGRLSNPDA